MTLSEHDEQTTLVKWFDLQYPSHRGRLLAIPNGGQRHPVVAVRLKAEGVRAGVPDLCLPIPNEHYHGLWIELKVKGGRPTAAQLDWLHYLSEQGYLAVLCVGADAAMQTIRDYLE